MNPFIHYFAKVAGGRAIRFPESAYNAYFETIFELFGLDRVQAEKALLRGQLSCATAIFWAEDGYSSLRRPPQPAIQARWIQ